MIAFRRRGLLLLALAGLIIGDRAAAQDLLEPALLPPASLAGPTGALPLTPVQADPDYVPLTLSMLEASASTIELLPKPGYWIPPAPQPDYQASQRGLSLQPAYETARKSAGRSDDSFRTAVSRASDDVGGSSALPAWRWWTTRFPESSRIWRRPARSMQAGR